MFISGAFPLRVPFIIVGHDGCRRRRCVVAQPTDVAQCNVEDDALPADLINRLPGVVQGESPVVGKERASQPLPQDGSQVGRPVERAQGGGLRRAFGVVAPGPTHGIRRRRREGGFQTVRRPGDEQ